MPSTSDEGYSLMMTGPDISWQRLAAAYVYKQIVAVQEYLPCLSIRREIEPLHQVRVASRRIRTALGVFEGCFSQGDVKQWRKAFGKLTKNLGEARDLDIAISHLDDVSEHLEHQVCQPGVKRLRLRLEQRRQAMQKRVEKTAAAMDRKGVLDEMLSEVGRIRYGTRRYRPAARSEAVFVQGREHIQRCLNDVKALAGCLECFDAINEHHKLRIAFKHLRYTMEIFRRSYRGRLDGSIKAARKLQTILGDLHDADMWLESLERFAREELERTEEYFGHARPYRRLRAGIEYLREEQRQKRLSLFHKLQRYWQHVQDHQVWQTLEQTLRAPMADAPETTVEAPAAVIHEIANRPAWRETVRIKPAS